MFTTCYCLLTDLHAVQACEEPVPNPSLVSEWPCTITAMEGKGGPEEVRSEEKGEESKKDEKEEGAEGMEGEVSEEVISLEGKEEEGLQRKCLTGWINYQLSRHPRPPQGTDLEIKTFKP